MNLIAGLFLNEQDATKAFAALQEKGFEKKRLTMLVRRKVPQPQFTDRAVVADVGRSAAIGAIIVGLLGLLLALLVGYGLIPVQDLMPSFEPGNVRMILLLGTISFAVAALTGAILGAAYVLIRSQEAPEITEKGVKRGGMLLAVTAEDTEKATARAVLKESGAVDIENLADAWDPEVWSRYRGIEEPGD